MKDVAGELYHTVLEAYISEQERGGLRAVPVAALIRPQAYQLLFVILTLANHQWSALGFN